MLAFVFGPPAQRAYALEWLVTDMASLNAAIAAANAETSGTHTITFGDDITLMAPSTGINLQPGVTLIIEGLGFTLDGAGTFRGFNILSGTVDIQDLNITNGYAESGGGIWNYGTLTVTDSSFSNNSAFGVGGGIFNLSTVTVTNSTFSANSAMQGGAVNNQPSSMLTLTNSTFSDNSTDSFGGGIINNGTLTVTNSTFSGNSAGVVGGGIFNDGYGTLNLVNTILANSTAGGDCANAGAMGTDVHNLIEANSGCGTAVSSADPLLGPLQDNGGPTHTMAIDHTSPAFNTGDNSTCPASDQRGEPRPQGATCDIGAYEASPPTVLTVNSLDDPGDGICDPTECTLREAIAALAADGTIDFDAGLEGTIALASQLTIDKNLTINGSSLASHIILSGGDSVRVFYINSGVDATLIGLDITRGYADNGGGIYNDFGTLSLMDSSISACDATSDGGGIFNAGGILTVTDSTLSGNSATIGGGILNYGILTMTGSTFSDNNASFGGGIFNYIEVTVTNSTFSANSASQGGGIWSEGLLTVTNSTFSGNSAPSSGGGIYNFDTLNLVNTILANSTAGGDCYNTGVINTDVHNLIEANSGCGTPVSSADPLLGPLQDNGGPTHTMAIDHTSPAYNAGDNGACPASDQRGNLRPAGAACDIGAYEATPPAALTVNSLNDPGDGICDPTECTLREAIAALAADGTIDFDAGLEGTIALASQLTIDKNLTIDGSSLASHIVLSGGDSVRVFYINSGVDATLIGLDITRGYADNGGGIYNDFGTLSLMDSSISACEATSDGGGIFNDGDILTVTDSTLSGNSAYFGGGIYSTEGSLTLTNSTLSGNFAYIGGGIRNHGILTVTDCTFSGNIGADYGGGIESDDEATVTNSTFSGNDALYGGGILSEGVLTVTNCTFSSNFADANGSGIDHWGTLNLSNTILVDGSTDDDCVHEGSMGTDLNNLIEDNLGCGSPVSSADPLLGLLQDNGGPTHTMAIDHTSPAFNAGDDPSCPLTDQRDVARPNGAACDIGAYEYQIPAPVDFDFDNTSDVVVFRGGAWRFFDYATASFDHGLWTGTSPGCIPAPMDYDGDGGIEPTQLCGGAWHFYNDDGSYNKGIWTGGMAGDLPVPADYDGDGTDDVVVWRAGAWRFFNFASGLFDHGVWTGAPPHWLGGPSIPVPMDYDGDGAADFTVWSGGPWHFYNDDGSYNKGIWTGGVADDMPAPADYDGDITEEVVVWRNGAWRFFDFVTGAFDHGVWTGAPPHWLGGTPLPSPLDYDGDGIVDFTVWSGGPWHFYNTDGSYAKGIWTGGVAGDLPISRRMLP